MNDLDNSPYFIVDVPTGSVGMIDGELYRFYYGLDAKFDPITDKCISRPWIDIKPIPQSVFDTYINMRAWSEEQKKYREEVLLKFISPIWRL